MMVSTVLVGATAALLCPHSTTRGSVSSALSRRIRAASPLLAEGYDWDTAWQRRAEDGLPKSVASELRDLATSEKDLDERSEAPATGLTRANAVPIALKKSAAAALDVRQWRLPFGFFRFMAQTDLFGTALGITMLAWVMFYLAAVPATYAFGPALGLQDVSNLDVQTVARAIFLPGWPACLVVATGVMLLRRGGAPAQ